MAKYKANSYYLIIRIFFLLLPPIIIGYVIYQPKTPEDVIFGGVFVIMPFVIYIVKLLSDLVYVEFNENDMIITYLITKKEKKIPYLNLLTWECIDGQRGYHINVIKFKSDFFLGTSKIKVDRVVDSDQFISFVKWLKSKNDKIKFKITPSDSKLLYEFNKEIGLKE